MSTPSTLECVRLEYDDGAGIDFKSAGDALFHLSYGRDASMRGVTGLRAVTRIDDSGPDELGELIWDRESLQALVDQAHDSEETPAKGEQPDHTTADAIAKIAEEA